MGAMRVVQRSIVVVALLTAAAPAGCAKRPATTAASTPPPTAGAVSRAQEPGPSGPVSPPATVQPATPPAEPTTPAPTARPAPGEYRSIEALKDIHFDFDRYDVRPGDAKILDGNAEWMKANVGYLILIEGHADERGTNEYNLTLGERRAKAAMNYLVTRGIQVSRMTIISYGEERSLCTLKTEECWARNRRAHFLVRPQ